MGSRHARVDDARQTLGQIENHYVDELAAGRLSRREFLRRASAVGIGLPTIGVLLAACGEANKKERAIALRRSPRRGGSLRVAANTPTGSINPLTVADAGGLLMLSQTGEFLAFDSRAHQRLVPMLATRWSANRDGSVWRFTLRSGVRFHDGRELTAADVVYTFRQLTKPHNASNALSTLGGVLDPSGVRALGRDVVEFRLTGPNGNFPYLVSSDNYNAIIVPAGTDYGAWEHSFVGTGPFKLHSYATGSGATFVRNDAYWGGQAHLDGTHFVFYGEQEAQVVALRGGEVDVLAAFTAAGAEPVLDSSSYAIIKMPSSLHRELSMRCDRDPFRDPRVRRAVALTLDRPPLVPALLNGYGTIANDYPFGPRFSSTDTSVPQRTQNLRLARQLLGAAGHPHGFATVLYTEQNAEIPQLAQAIQADARRTGIDISLRVETPATYYGKATYGQSDWLDGTMSLVDYGDRAVPNALLEATLTPTGPWNAARFDNPTYTRLAGQFVTALDLQTQRRIAGQIERLLLEQTPIIYPYWMDALTANSSRVAGLNPTPVGQLFLGAAYVT